MITISSEEKLAIQRFMGEDGKLIITDEMPEDLKSAIEYLNENNINIFDALENDDDYDEDYDDDDDELFDLNDSSDDDVYSELPEKKVAFEETDDSLDDLNDLF